MKLCWSKWLTVQTVVPFTRAAACSLNTASHKVLKHLHKTAQNIDICQNTYIFQKEQGSCYNLLCVLGKKPYNTKSLRDLRSQEGTGLRFYVSSVCEEHS